MNEAILRNYESKITGDDDVYILGDFIFGGEKVRKQADNYLNRIPGRKHLIIGNHDPEWVRRLSGWTSVQDYLEVCDERVLFALSHYPMKTWNNSRWGSIQFFGHIHSAWSGSHNSINVGVDVWDYMPINRHDIMLRANTLPLHKAWFDVEPDAFVERHV